MTKSGGFKAPCIPRPTQADGSCSLTQTTVRRHQEQSSDLQVQNYKLTEELEDQKSKLKDINDFLVNELKARALSYAALQAELAETKKKMAEDKAAFTVLV